MSFIDVHNHISSQAYIDLLTEHGKSLFSLQKDMEGHTVVMRGDARFMTFTEQMFDPEIRLVEMTAVGVQRQLLSYTCPNCYWAEDSIALNICQVMNNHVKEVCDRWPDRFSGLASLPMQNVDMALHELERAVDQLEMVGLIILANVNELPLDDDRFDPLWAALNERKLPVLLHPTTPPGVDMMGMDKYGLVPSVGFMIDTTLAVTRMVLGGVFERYPDWPLIVSHAGATLPYLASRLDQCHRFIPDARLKISDPPTKYLRNLYYDTVCYDELALSMALDLAGPEHLLYGSDYPHNIGDMKGCADRVNSLSIGNDDKELIRRGNAVRLFGID